MRGGNGLVCVATARDGDGHVDVIDLLILVASWGKGPAGAGHDPACDLGGDGTVDLAALLIMIEGRGK